jgi:hypothetical protein
LQHEVPSTCIQSKEGGKNELNHFPENTKLSRITEKDSEGNDFVAPITVRRHSGMAGHIVKKG